MSILGLILLIIVFNLIFKIIRSLFQVNMERKGNKYRKGKSTLKVETPPPQKKIFSSSEGEYVDFEEIPQDPTEETMKVD